MDTVWQIILMIATNLFSGGLVWVFTITSHKKKEEASARKASYEADASGLDVTSKNILNVESAINIYKTAIEDMNNLIKTKEDLYLDTINSLTNKLDSSIVEVKE